MKNKIYAKLLALVMVAGSAFAMLAVSFDAEARRIGGGGSSGRQSTNVMQQRQATQAPAAAAPTAGAAAAGAGARAGASRWLGPLAGIAAGLGIAALLSHLGLGGALADMLVIALIAGVAFFGIRFLLRSMRPNSAAPAGAAGGGMGGQGMNRQAFDQNRGQQPLQQPAQQPAQNLFGAASAASQNAHSEPVVGSWFIPAGFDQQTFIEESKRQFIAVQKAWDDGDRAELRDRLTDDFYSEFSAQLDQRTGVNKTEVVLLNADLLGIEKLPDGYLSSVRFSGMIREDDNPEAAGFEEVWNLYKQDGQGWLLAGVQQMPGGHA